MNRSRMSRPFVRPGFARWSTVLFILLLPFVALSAFNYVETKRFSSRVSGVMAKGEPVSVSEAMRAAQPLRPVSDSDRFYIAAASLRSADSATALSLLDRAVVLPFDGFEPGSESSYLTANLLELANLAGRRTTDRVRAGDAKSAAVSLNAEIRLRYAIETRQNSGLVGVFPLTARLGEVISLTPPDPNSLADLERSVADLDRDDVLKRFFVLARAAWIDRGSREFARSGFWLHRSNRAIDALNGQVAAAEQPWPQRLDSLGVVQSSGLRAGYKIPSSNPTSLIGFGFGFGDSEYLQSVGTFIAQNLTLNLTMIRCARVIIAVERFRREHQDHDPMSLEQLVPNYLSALPVDPYSGKSFNLKLRADGYALYSAGPNRRDDGGNIGETIPRNADEADKTPDLGMFVRHQPNP
jgi:hypothetical protein